MARTRLPRGIERELAKIEADWVVIAAVRTIAHTDAAMLQALGLELLGDTLASGESRPPERNCGLYARRNLDGWREKRNDLPMVDRHVALGTELAR